MDLAVSNKLPIFVLGINHTAWKMISNNYAYDLSGNPQKIYFTNGSITKYVYSASGQKLRVVHYTAVKNITRSIGQHVELTAAQIQSTDSTDYLLGGSLVVKNGKIDRYLFDGGYAKATASGTTDNFAFFYQNRDHLGTVRETVTSTGAMKQRVNYYPFGGQLVDTLKAMIWNRDFQQYKYNGKEFDGTFGLNTYDYGARQHYPVLARWDRIDPLCEKEPGVSPYAYCANNPVKFIDPDGRKKHNWVDKSNDASKNASRQWRYEHGFSTPFVQIWAHGIIPEGSSMAVGINANICYREKRRRGSGYCKHISNEKMEIETAKDLNTLLNKYDKDWSKRKKGAKAVLILHSCSTSELAKEMSSDEDLKDVYIIAPNSTITPSETGDECVDPTEEGEEGRWEVYRNGETVKDDTGAPITYPADSQVGTKGFDYGF